MDITEFVLKLLNTVAWPIATFGTAFLFRRPIADLISRVHSVSSKVANVTFTEIQKIGEDLPAPNVDATPSVREVPKALKFPPKSIETVLPSSELPVSEADDPISATVLLPVIEAAWQRLLAGLKEHAATKLKHASDTSTFLLDPRLSASSLSPQISTAISKLADIRDNFRTKTLSVDCATVIAFAETVDKILFILQDQQS